MNVKFLLTIILVLCTITVQAQDELDKLLDTLTQEPIKKAEPVIPNPTVIDSIPMEREIRTIEPKLSPEVENAFTPQPKAESTPKPTPSPTPEPTPAPDGLEETTIYQIQTIEVKKEGEEKFENMRITIPVYYRTRSIAWEQNEIRKGLTLQQRIKEYTEKLETIKQEGELLLEEYNRLILSGIPQEALQSDSPSLPEGNRKESTKPLLRNSDISIKIKDNE